MFSYCAYISEIHKLYRYIARFDQDYQISGFVPVSAEASFRKQFEGLDVQIELRDPDEASQLTPPTKLHNNWLFRPFEMFVEMYGLPNYKDIDPTPFVAVTFWYSFRGKS